MGEEKEEEIPGVELYVKMSPISGSGIARVHVSVVEKNEFMEGKVVSVESGKNRRVLRLVADSMMDRGRISLRRKDMDKLGVKEGSKVTIRPMKGMGDRLSKKFKFLGR